MRLGDRACCRRNGRSLGNRYGPGTGPIWLDELNCRGSETQLGNCPHRGWSSNDCSHSEDVSIGCNNYSTSGGLNNLLYSLRVCDIITLNAKNTWSLVLLKILTLVLRELLGQTDRVGKYYIYLWTIGHSYSLITQMVDPPPLSQIW